MRDFQPCPLCGNCQLFRKSKLDKHGQQVRAHCSKDATPEFRSNGDYHPYTGRALGSWICEDVSNRRNGKRRSKKSRRAYA